MNELRVQFRGLGNVKRVSVAHRAHVYFQQRGCFFRCRVLNFHKVLFAACLSEVERGGVQGLLNPELLVCHVVNEL